VIVKDIHIVTAAISISLFIFRFFWLLIGSRFNNIRFFYLFPHINDTILLITAVLLTLNVSQYPFVDHWLTAKLIALLVYIYLGRLALKRGNKGKFRIVSGFIAIFVFAFIVSVAISKDPSGYFSVLL